MNSETCSVFVSYSHADEAWLERLRVHLKALQHEGLRIDCWDDRRIKPGGAWRKEIRKAVEDAAIAILMVSADFLASDFIAKDELPPLLENASSGRTLILPVVVKPCRFRECESLSKFQAVNDPARPLVELSEGDREKVYVEVANAIANHVARGPRLRQLEGARWQLKADRSSALRKTLDDVSLSKEEKVGRFMEIYKSSSEKDRDICLEMAALSEGEEKQYYLEEAHKSDAFAVRFDEIAEKIRAEIDLKRDS